MVLPGPRVRARYRRGGAAVSARPAGSVEDHAPPRIVDPAITFNQGSGQGPRRRRPSSTPGTTAAQRLKPLRYVVRLSSAGQHQSRAIMSTSPRRLDNAPARPGRRPAWPGRWRGKGDWTEEEGAMEELGKDLLRYRAGRWPCSGSPATLGLKNPNAWWASGPLDGRRRVGPRRGGRGDRAKRRASGLRGRVRPLRRGLWAARQPARPLSGGVRPLLATTVLLDRIYLVWNALGLQGDGSRRSCSSTGSTALEQRLVLCGEPVRSVAVHQHGATTTWVGPAGGGTPGPGRGGPRGVRSRRAGGRHPLLRPARRPRRALTSSGRGNASPVAGLVEEGPT